MAEHAGRRAVAEAAAEWAADMAESLAPEPFRLGLGSGSTAEMFLAALGAMPGKRIANIVGMPSSKRVETLARKSKIAVMDATGPSWLHLAVDGADEFDRDLVLIKGGGGALLREKIVAEAALEIIIIADAGKQVDRLGAFPLPVEISPFYPGATLDAIRTELKGLDYDIADECVRLRKIEGEPFVTDGGNWIVDLELGSIKDPWLTDTILCGVPGLLATGLFCGLADRVLVGHEDGGIDILEPDPSEDTDRRES